MKLKNPFQEIYILYVWLPLVALSIAGVITYYKVTGDLQVCRVYYKEMSTLQCFFSSKTVRIPGQSK